MTSSYMSHNFSKTQFWRFESFSLDLAPSLAFYGHLVINHSWLFAVIRGYSWSFTVIYGHPYNGEPAVRSFSGFLSDFIFQPIRIQLTDNPRDHFLSISSSCTVQNFFYFSGTLIYYPFYIFYMKSMRFGRVRLDHVITDMINKTKIVV